MGETPRPTRRTPDTIYHITEANHWLPDNDEYAPDSLADEGFIHASSWDQLQGVAVNIFARRTDIVVLEIDATLLPTSPVWEDLYNLGQDYPHVYSPIPTAAVLDTLEVTWDPTGAPWFHLAEVPAGSDRIPDLAWTRLSDPSETDLASLARMNGQLIDDEGHDNSMNRHRLADRMREFLASTYTAYLMTMGNLTAGYALVDLSQDPPYLRQFFVRRGLRRRHIGTRAFEILRTQLGDSLPTVDVLSGNGAAVRFWHSLGFEDRSVAMRLPGAESSQPKRAGNTQGTPTVKLERLAGDTRQAARFLKEKIREFNDDVSPHHRQARRSGAVTEIAVMATDADGRWLGGVCGRVYWNWLAVDDFWVSPGNRRRGTGALLLRDIEEMARSRGATRVQLTTFSFQARAFYETHGYEVVGQLEDYPPGASMFWLRKDL